MKDDDLLKKLRTRKPIVKDDSFQQKVPVTFGSGPRPINKIEDGEKSILDSLENQLILHNKLKDVYKNRPEISSFEGTMSGMKGEEGYTKEAIRRDEKYIIDTRKKIEEENRANGRENLNRIEGGFQLSEILQAMIVDQMNKNWFKECSSIMTSDYDDLAVGIDGVIKHKKGGYLGVSLDFTVTGQRDVVKKKLNNEWDNNVTKGRIPRIKYFEDPDTKQKMSLTCPKFIIGASKKEVEEFANAYLKDDFSTLENHPFKYIILMQIEEQLQTKLDYCEANSDNESFKFAKGKYEQIQNILRNMKNEIGGDAKMKEVDIYAYSLDSMALDEMKKFRIERPKY